MRPDHYRTEAERLARLVSETQDWSRRAEYRLLAQSYRSRAAAVEARLRAHGHG